MSDSGVYENQDEKSHRLVLPAGAGGTTRYASAGLTLSSKIHK